MSAQVAADLRAAAEVLRRDGWTQGTFHARADETRICHCAEGAIHLIAGAHVDLRVEPGLLGDVNWRVDYDSVSADVRDDAAMRFLTDFLDSTPARWNDAPGRTADEVIASLEAAADAADRAVSEQ